MGDHAGDVELDAVGAARLDHPLAHLRRPHPRLPDRATLHDRAHSKGFTMKKIVLLFSPLPAVLLVSAANGGIFSSAPAVDPSTAIHAVIDAQTAAWNRGDIDAYMDGYARSDDTM